MSAEPRAMNGLETLHRTPGGWRVGETNLILARPTPDPRWGIRADWGLTPPHRAIYEWAQSHYLEEMRFATRRQAHRAVVALWLADPPTDQTHRRVKLRRLSPDALVSRRGGYRIERVQHDERPDSWNVIWPDRRVRSFPTLVAARLDVDRHAAMNAYWNYED